MSALAVVGFDPLKDKSYAATRLGRSVVDFLAWMELGGAADRTLDQYERDLSRACLMFPKLELQRWTDRECMDVVKSFPKPSRRFRAAAIDSFFTWALRQDRIDRNPMDKLPPIKRTPQKFIDVFSDQEIEDLYTLPTIDSALMGILFECGLRKAEARKLQVRRLVLSEGVAASRSWPQIDPSAEPGVKDQNLAPSESTGELVVIAGKGGKDRTVQFGGRLHSLLSELLLLEQPKPQDHLWYTRPGGGPVSRVKPIGDGSFDRWWRSCLHESGVRYRNPHVARHTFATRWLKRGGRLETLSRLMGHSSIAITADCYSHLQTSDVLHDLALVESHRS